MIKYKCALIQLLLDPLHNFNENEKKKKRVEGKLCLFYIITM